MPYGSGTTPRKSDSQRMLWAKRLIFIQARKTNSAANNPSLDSDTQRILSGKFDRSKNNVSGTTVNF